jgi:exoribonuclease-2
MEPGSLIEYIDSRKVVCAVVLELKKLRVRLLNENNRELKLSASRLSHISRARLDLSQGRDRLAAALKQTAARRRELSTQVNVFELWEVLNGESEWIDLKTMTDLCFPNAGDSDHEAAVTRAFFDDRLYFRFGIDKFYPHSPDKVEQLKAQRQAEARREQIVHQGAQWMVKVLKGQEASWPAQGRETVEILISYYLHDKESPHRDAARNILNQAGIDATSAIFSFLVRIGVWQQDENLDLLRFEISAEIPPQVNALAASIEHHPPEIEAQRMDLRDMNLLTIDGPATLDFDDALSITPKGQNYTIGIHIADVAHFVRRDDGIDQEAKSRASSIYMPDQKISMLPAVLAEGMCSLKAGMDRPAISTLVTVTPQAEIIDYRIVPSIIRVKHQLTYHDVDDAATEKTELSALKSIALLYRRRRLDNGALIIDLPEIAVWLTPAGEPMFAKVDRESPGRLLVSELMIMANDLAARFLEKNNIPAIFRSQPEPRERLFDRDQGTLFQNWMQRKLLNRFVLSSTAQPHAGLGLKAYVTATSPIRKFSDLVVQRQLRAAMGLDNAYTSEEMDFLIATLREPLSQVGQVQFRRHRYWLLKHLESRIGHKEDALVLMKRRKGYAILLTDYMIECTLSGAEGIKLKPEDLIRVTVQHVSARNDTLTVFLA